MADEKKNDAVEVSRAEQRKLFEDYDRLASAVSKADKTLLDARKQLSDHVKKIRDALGTGPFIFKGRSLTAAHKGDTWFFKTRSDEGAVRID